MKARVFQPGRIFAGRLQYGADLLKDILDYAQKEEANPACFSALGAVQKVTLAFYDQKAKQYDEITFHQPMEIVACFGNISLKEGEPHIHAHGVFADEAGHTVAGHIQPGTILFAGEIQLQALIGEALVREYDQVTGLYLWNI